MGYPVFYSDYESKVILNTDPSVRQKIIQLFGKEAYLENELNRIHIGNIVFKDPKLLNKLNNIVHPAVRNTFDKWIDEQDSPFVFNESALLFETGIYKEYDKNVLVISPLELRISRVMKRDKTSRESVLNRINNQWSDDQKRELASNVIINDDESLLIPQVISFLEKLRK